MKIKASQVKELRDMTGVAMMDCKKALVECCLLYTSPSPRDLMRSRMPSSA